MTIAKFLLPLALLFTAGSAEDPLVDLCQQFTQKFNFLQNLVPLEIDVRLGRGRTSPFIEGPAVFKLASHLTVKSTSPCYSNKTTTGIQVVLKLSASTSFIVTTTRILTVTGNDFTLNLDVVLSKTGAMKTVTFKNFKIETDAMTEGSGSINSLNKDAIERDLTNELSDKLKNKVHGVFHRSKKVKLSHRVVYTLMREVYLSVAQYF